MIATTFCRQSSHDDSCIPHPGIRLGPEPERRTRVARGGSINFSVANRTSSTEGTEYMEAGIGSQRKRIGPDPSQLPGWNFAEYNRRERLVLTIQFNFSVISVPFVERVLGELRTSVTSVVRTRASRRARRAPH